MKNILIVSASEAFSTYLQYGSLVKFLVIFSVFVNCIKYFTDSQSKIQCIYQHAQKTNKA